MKVAPHVVREGTARLAGRQPGRHARPAAAPLLHLQRTVGNRALGALIATAAGATLRQSAIIGFERRLLNAVVFSRTEGSIKTAGGHTPSVRRGGPAAAQLAETGNRAAALGTTILLTDDAPAPDTAEGRALMRHEAVHIDQQAGAAVVPAISERRRSRSEDEANRVEAAYGPVALQPTRFVLYQLGASTVVRKSAARALEWLARRGANVSMHVMSRHIARRLGKSRFIQGKFVKKWVEATVKTTDNVVDQGRRLVFQREFGREVGRGGERIVRVVVDKVTGAVVTAFPAKTFLRAVPFAVGAASVQASRADAAILARRAAIEEMLDQPWPIDVINFLLDTSEVARSEDIPAEARIVDEAVDAAIEAVEQQLQQSLGQEDRDAITEMVLTEMEVQ